MISTVLDVVGSVLLLVGLALVTIGVYGLLHLRDTYTQLHAQGLATGPGVICILASSIATENSTIITSAALTIAFLLLSSPASSHAIAHAAPGRPEESGNHDRADRSS